MKVRVTIEFDHHATATDEATLDLETLGVGIRTIEACVQAGQDSARLISAAREQSYFVTVEPPAVALSQS